MVVGDKCSLEAQEGIMKQKKLKKLVKKVIRAEVWDEPELIKARIRHCAYVVQLSDGHIVFLDKPDVLHKKKAIKNPISFVQRNMKQITDCIDRLEKSLNGQKVCYFHTAYAGMSKDTKLVRYFFTDPQTKEDELLYSVIKEASKEDVECLIAGWQKVEKKFAKKLQKYLK